MTPFLRTLLGVVAAAPLAAAAAAESGAGWPATGRIVFEVRHGSSGFVVGRGEHAWQHDGRRYTLRAMTETTGVAALFSKSKTEQESRGALGPAGLQPQEFKTLRNGKPRDGARFDPAGCRVTLANGGSAACIGVAQDLLSLCYQAGRWPLAGSTDVTVTTGRKTAAYVVTPGRTQTLELPFGARQVRLITVTIAQGKGAEDSTEIWLDTESRLPLRIRYRDRAGEIFDQVATLIELDKPHEQH